MNGKCTILIQVSNLEIDSIHPMSTGDGEFNVGRGRQQDCYEHYSNSFRA